MAAGTPLRSTRAPLPASHADRWSRRYVGVWTRRDADMSMIGRVRAPASGGPSCVWTHRRVDRRAADRHARCRPPSLRGTGNPQHINECACGRVESWTCRPEGMLQQRRRPIVHPRRHADMWTPPRFDTKADGRDASDRSARRGNRSTREHVRPWTRRMADTSDRGQVHMRRHVFPLAWSASQC